MTVPVGNSRFDEGRKKIPHSRAAIAIGRERDQAHEPAATIPPTKRSPAISRGSPIVLTVGIASNE